MKIVKYILLLFLLESCNEKEIIINLDKHESKLTVNSLFSPSETIKINLSKSIPVLDKDTINFIENAEVQFYCQNQFIDNMSYDKDGMYYLNTMINSGIEYSIRINVPGFEAVTASCTVPEKPQVLYLDTIAIDDEYLYCEIEFMNDLKTPNYYSLEIFSKYPVYDSDSNLSNQIKIINSDMIVENGDLGSELKRIFFSGELLRDSVYALGLVLNKKTLLNTNSHNSNTAYIHFRKISEEYYLYVKSLNAATSRQDETFTNIENGYGIFSAYNVCLDSIVIHK